MKCGFIVKHRGSWPTAWVCEALGVSRGGLYAWLTRPRSQRARRDEVLGAKIRTSFLQSDRTYDARRVWHDLLAEGEACGLHRIERLMRQQALRARPRRPRVPADDGPQPLDAVSPNVLHRQFDAPAPTRKWVADFTLKYLVESGPPAWATVTRHNKGGSNARDHDEGTKHLAHCDTTSPHHQESVSDMTLYRGVWLQRRGSAIWIGPEDGPDLASPMGGRRTCRVGPTPSAQTSPEAVRGDGPTD